MAKLIRWCAAFDSHGSLIDRDAEAAFFEFVKHWKPDLRIHGGDFVDACAMRRGASDEERAEGMTADVEAGVDFLRRFDPQVVTLGNHDWRIWNGAVEHHNGVVRTLCSMLVDRITDALPATKFVEYNKRTGFYQLGQYRLLHGFHTGVYAARQASQVFGNVIMGHIHAPSYFCSPHIDGCEGFSVGALAQLELGYNRASPNTLRQAHGWAYGILIGKQAQVWLAQKIGGAWVYPQGVKVA